MPNVTRRSSLLAVVLSGPLLVLGGTWFCSADEPHDEVVTLTDAEKRAVVKFMATQTQQAKTHLREGRYQLAYRLADAIITLSPDVPFRREVRHIRRTAEARHLGETMLGLEFSPTPGLPFPITVLTGRLILENISNEPISVGAEEGVPLGMCEYQVFEVFADGSSWTSRGSKVIRSEGSFVLDEKKRRALPVELDLRRVDRPPVLQWIRVDGSFRPTDLRVGDDGISRSIPWQPVEVVVVAEQYRDVEDDPRAALAQALKEYHGPRIAVAGHLWARELVERGDLGAEAREKTIDLLVAQLDPDVDQALDRLIMRLLEEIAGVELRPMRDTWLRWHRVRRRSQ